LAADFDKADWQYAAAAFRQACNDWGVSCAVERSRSGNGAHVWIFFEQAIAAKDARRLGFALLDKAMERHAGLSFESYDRLFPNQDTMPAGGFGNLIAYRYRISHASQAIAHLLMSCLNPTQISGLIWHRCRKSAPKNSMSV
jgi:hypothetical protein